MSSVDKSSPPPVCDLLSLMKSPYYLEDGVRLDFLVKNGVTGKDLFSSIIYNISSGTFDGYLGGVSVYPREINFSSLQRAYPWVTHGLIKNYNGRILLQEKNHFPASSGSLAYFYHHDSNPHLAYLHLYDKTILDFLRTENIIKPWCSDFSLVVDDVHRTFEKYKRGRR